MKLKIKKTAIIGDPEIGGEVEIKTNGRTYDIEVVKEKMSFQVYRKKVKTLLSSLELREWNSKSRSHAQS